MRNKYFAKATTTEKNIVVNQVAELIQISGIDVFYIPRKLNKLDSLYGEDVLSSFETKFEIEMLLNDVSEFGGDGAMLEKFGLEVRDEVNFTVSSKRFKEVVKFDEPREGDLIYFTDQNALFEIKYVDYNKKLFAHNTTPKFDIKCELFEYSNETIEVGITELDGLDGVDTVIEDGKSVDKKVPVFDNTSINDIIMSEFGDPYVDNPTPKPSITVEPEPQQTTQAESSSYDASDPFNF